MPIDELITDFVIEETLRDERGLPVGVREVVDFETGKLRDDVVARLKTAVELKLSIEGVKIKRYPLKSELSTLLEVKDG